MAEPGPARPGAPRLADVCGGRDNNLNLIRMVAASAVLVSHAFPIAFGPGTAEPLEAILDRTLGSVAVFIFFAISGFLIARSFDRKARMADWISARIMRLFPGLVVVLALTVLVLGPLTTTLPLAEYATDPGLLTYLLRNVTLVSLQYNLPGVFEDLVYPGVINGSLWTLFHEVMCYGGVLLAGLLGLLSRPKLAAPVLLAYFALYLVAMSPAMKPLVHPKLLALCKLSLPFALGTTFYIWRDRIRLSWLWLAGLTVLCGAASFTPFFAEVFTLTLSYGVFVLAYLPGGMIRRYNMLGDYSYGMYIYAFPMQQICMHVAGPMTPWQNMAMALPLTLICAILSWQLVEKPGLAARHRVADWLDRQGNRRSASQ